jgi:hypothetical protein
MQYQKGYDSKFVVIRVGGTNKKYRVEVEFLDVDISAINVYRAVNKPIEEVQDEPESERQSKVSEDATTKEA